jgi:hypothetical protein
LICKRVHTQASACAGELQGFVSSVPLYEIQGEKRQKAYAFVTAKQKEFERFSKDIVCGATMIVGAGGGKRPKKRENTIF